MVEQCSKAMSMGISIASGLVVVKCRERGGFGRSRRGPSAAFCWGRCEAFQRGGAIIHPISGISQPTPVQPSFLSISRLMSWLKDTCTYGNLSCLTRLCSSSFSTSQCNSDNFNKNGLLLPSVCSYSTTLKTLPRTQDLALRTPGGAVAANCRPRRTNHHRSVEAVQILRVQVAKLTLIRRLSYIKYDFCTNNWISIFLSRAPVQLNLEGHHSIHNQTWYHHPTSSPRIVYRNKLFTFCGFKSKTLLLASKAELHFVIPAGLPLSTRINHTLFSTSPHRMKIWFLGRRLLTTVKPETTCRPRIGI